MNRSTLAQRAPEPQGQDVTRGASERDGVGGGACHHAFGAERRRERPGGLAEIRHVEGPPHVLPGGMAGGMVPDGEQDARIGFARLGSCPAGRGLGVEQDGGVAQRPRVRFLSRAADRCHRIGDVRIPKRVVEPGSSDRRHAALLIPLFGYAPDRFRDRLDVDQPRGAETRRDPGPDLFRRQSAPWRTYACTIEPCGTVVWAIKFHPLSSTPRPTCESAMRVKGPMTDSRPTLETPSMMTPG